MKHKILSFLTAFAMVFGIIAAPFVNVSAAPSTATTTEDVTIHKILLTKEKLDAHDVNKDGYDGTELENIKDYFDDQSAKEIAGVYFKLQKLKDGIAEDKIDVNDDSQWEDINCEGRTGETGIEFKTPNFSGKYRIVEDLTKSTYEGDDGEQLAKAKAVPSLITLPLVNNDGIVAHAHVYPKNTQDKPQIDKNFAKDNTLEQAEGFDPADAGAEANVGADYNNYQKKKATVKAELGKEIPYEVKTEIPQDAKYKKLVWNDTMTNGLTFQEGSLVIEGAGLVDGDYTIFEDARGFKLTLNEQGLKKVEEAAENAKVEIKLTYKAKVNSNAIVDIPEANDIKLDYGNKQGKEFEPKEGKPVNKEIKVEKTWGEDGDSTVTEEDKNAVVVYTLQKKNGDKWENVESVTKKYDENNPDTSYNHTFTGLDDNETYRVVERVSGYDAENTEFVDGVTKYKNVKDTDNPNPLNPTEPKVVNGGKKFVKTNQDGKERLAGAEFYITNQAGDKYLVASKNNADEVKAAKDELDKRVAAYNKLTAEEQKGEKGTQAKEAIDMAQEAYNKAFIKNANAYTWGEKTDPNVVVVTSDGQGRFEIKGLAYGTYKLEEKTAPAGYANRNDKPEFKVEKGSYQGNDKEISYNKDDTNNGYGQQIINKKVSIPQTGGIGSIIFVVAGLLIMGLAAYKIRANRKEA